jgi:SAM-dependent methyltransferase
MSDKPLMTDTVRREQFEYERQAAQRLMGATSAERPELYRQVYEEYYRRFGSAYAYDEGDGDPKVIRSQFQFVRRFLNKGRDDFVEIGTGSGKLCVEIAKLAKSCIGIDAVKRVDVDSELPANCTFLASDVVSLSLPAESVDVAFSSQLLEHLHPDDCRALIANIFSALRPGGLFINIVPNRLTGPHDVSMHFVDEAEGLHLHEYDNRELSRLMRGSGFSHCTSYVGARGFFIPVPSALIGIVESALEVIPHALRRAAAFRAIVGIRMVAKKPSHAGSK